MQHERLTDAEPNPAGRGLFIAYDGAGAVVRRGVTHPTLQHLLTARGSTTLVPVDNPEARAALRDPGSYTFDGARRGGAGGFARNDD